MSGDADDDSQHQQDGHPYRYGQHPAEFSYLLCQRSRRNHRMGRILPSMNQKPVSRRVVEIVGLQRCVEMAKVFVENVSGDGDIHESLIVTDLSDRAKSHSQVVFYGNLFHSPLISIPGNNGNAITSSSQYQRFQAFGHISIVTGAENRW